jgi:hypothetical protein
MKRNAIALLLTLFFMMLISVAISVGLENITKTKNEIKRESFIIQSSIVIDDVLSMLKNSPEVSAITKDETPASFFAFLSSSSFIPLDLENYKISIKIKSARDRFNINALKDSNSTISQTRFAIFKEYLTNHQIDEALAYMIIDSMLGIKEDMTYYSDIFFKKPELFRDYIASANHLETILKYYSNEYKDNVFKKLDFEKFLTFDKDINTKIDLNQASVETWEFLLGCPKQRAEDIVKNAGLYQSLDDIGLDKERLSNFSTSFLEPVVKVSIEISDEELYGKIEFLYDLKKKKGYNFVYTI